MDWLTAILLSLAGLLLAGALVTLALSWALRPPKQAKKQDLL